MRASHDIVDGQSGLGVECQRRLHISVRQSRVEHGLWQGIFYTRQLNNFVRGGETLVTIHQRIGTGRCSRAVTEVQIERHKVALEHSADATAVLEIESAANVVGKLVGVGKVLGMRIIMAQEARGEVLTERNRQTTIVSIALYDRLGARLVEHAVVHRLLLGACAGEQELFRIDLRGVIHFFVERSCRVHLPNGHFLRGERIAVVSVVIDVEKTRIGHGQAIGVSDHFLTTRQAERLGHIKLRHKVVGGARARLRIDHRSQPTAVRARHRRRSAHGACADRETQLCSAHRVLTRHHVDA